MSDLSYEERLRKLHLPTLTFRRIRGDMIETYKIMHEISDKDVTTFLKLRNQETERTSLRSHKYQLYIEPINKNIRKYNFSIRIINIWNNLPREVAEAPSVNTFKNRLDRYWRDQDLLYDYKAKLNTDRKTTGGRIEVDLDIVAADSSQLQNHP